MKMMSQNWTTRPRYQSNLTVRFSNQWRLVHLPHGRKKKGRREREMRGRRRRRRGVVRRAVKVTVKKKES